MISKAGDLFTQKKAGDQTLEMLRLLSPCRSWIKGEHDRRACRVAFRKHKFPELIKPRGSKSLTVMTGTLEACRVNSSKGTAADELVPLKFTSLEISPSRACSFEKGDWFGEPPSLSDTCKEIISTLSAILNSSFPLQRGWEWSNFWMSPFSFEHSEATGKRLFGVLALWPLLS